MFGGSRQSHELNAAIVMSWREHAGGLWVTADRVLRKGEAHQGLAAASSDAPALSGRLGGSMGVRQPYTMWRYAQPGWEEDPGYSNNALLRASSLRHWNFLHAGLLN